MNISLTKKSILWDVLIVVIMGVLLYYGTAWQLFTWYTDAGKYECYAVAFWQGTSALKTLPVNKLQCVFVTHPLPETIFMTNQTLLAILQSHHAPSWLITFIASQSVHVPFHSLPHEYPLLAIVPFTFGLVVAAHWYQVAFALGMYLFVVATYILLRVYRSRRAAIAFALFIVVGGWAVALARYDVVPAMLTLIALLCAERNKWRWAFATLALATMLKFYPVIFVPPLIIAQHSAKFGAWRGTWRTWMRSIHGLGTFVLVCAALTLFSLLLSVEGTLGPLGYFNNRPIQVESTASSILWLASFFSFHLHYVANYGSLNVISPLSPVISPLLTLATVVGLLYTFWLQWRGKLTLPVSFLLILLVVVCTGKVFSPQYLLWIFPLLAYVCELDRRWLVSWAGIGALTTWIFPYLYDETHNFLKVALLPLFNPVVLTRNVLLIAFTVVLFCYYARLRTDKVLPESLSPVQEPEAVMLLARQE